MLLVVGALHWSLALPAVGDDPVPPVEPVPPEEPEPEPEEPEPEEPVLLADPELLVEPVVLDPDTVLDGLEALAAEVAPDPEPPPHPERMSTAAETAQNDFNAFSDGKRTSSQATVLPGREATKPGPPATADPRQQYLCHGSNIPLISIT